MYYLYHIPNKKIGVTRNLNTRVTLMQGYKEGEYEVLEQSEDINYISDREIELQKSYGYKVDRQKYNNLIKPNKMEVNVTEQTTTFPVPTSKLKGRLQDLNDLRWQTSFGEFRLTKEAIDWILKNAYTSMYNSQRCFIYNKAFANKFIKKDIIKKEKNKTKEIKVFKSIRKWADERGLYTKGDPITQYVKLQEEAGELAQALLKDDQPEVIDAIGDMVVVLTNLSHQRGTSIEHCINSAYEVIAKRKGKMINGTFVKSTL